MTELSKALNVINPQTIPEWKRWCAAKDMTYDKAKVWLALQNHELSIEEWDQEIFDFALAINAHFDEVFHDKKPKVEMSQRREA